MAREVITRTLCDVCLQDDERTDAEDTPPVTIGGSPAKVVALCKDHRSSFEEFEELLTNLGQLDASASAAPTVKRGSRRALAPGEGVLCPVCDKRLKNASSRSVHMNTQHDTSITAWRESERAEGRSGILPDEDD